MLNRAWITRADQRIARLEAIAKPTGALGEQVPSELDRIRQLQAQIDAMQARIERLESTAHEHGPGRPGKVK